VGAPLGKRPNPHPLVAAILATEYLGIPADTEFIKALMRGLLTAISAKSAESLPVVARRYFASPSEVRCCPPVFKRRNHPLPAMATLLSGGNTNSIENISEGERQGTSDHRVLL
jgi:hypothetical protein